VLHASKAIHAAPSNRHRNISMELSISIGNPKGLTKAKLCNSGIHKRAGKKIRLDIFQDECDLIGRLKDRWVDCGDLDDFVFQFLYLNSYSALPIVSK